MKFLKRLLSLVLRKKVYIGIGVVTSNDGTSDLISTAKLFKAVDIPESLNFYRMKGRVLVFECIRQYSTDEESSMYELECVPYPVIKIHVNDHFLNRLFEKVDSSTKVF